MIDQTALHIALRAAGHTPDEIATMTEGWVWLGDLSGMEVAPAIREGRTGTPLQLRVAHRCGHEGVLIAGMGMDGISADGSAMLANLAEFAAKWREGHACPPHQPSPETAAMVQRWTDTASSAPKPVLGQGDPFGILQHVELVDVSDEEDEGEPIVKPVTGFDLYAMSRYGAGPDCGPIGIPPHAAGASDVITPGGVLRAVRDMNAQTSQTGHGPEDYPDPEEGPPCARCSAPASAHVEWASGHLYQEPADVPVRRCIDGKWQTVEITLSEFRANEGADGRQPFRVVDGPGCTPLVPPLPYSPPREDREGWVTDDEGSRVWGPDVVPQQDTGEPVARGSLYSDKCAECTTGVSCEDAGRCLFEG